jgi:hypothetical protein
MKTSIKNMKMKQIRGLAGNLPRVVLWLAVLPLAAFFGLPGVCQAQIDEGPIDQVPVTGPPSGCLEVTLAPAGAVAAGAQWQVDGGAWQTNGATVYTSLPGSHTVSFSGVSGWTAPASQTVTIDGCTTTTATYIPGGLAFTTDGTNITITGYSGPGGAVTIPSTLPGVGGTVTGIGDDAFQSCTGLTSVTIPNSLTSIGTNAFSGSANLTCVFFQGNAPSIGECVFFNDPATIYYLPGTTGWSTNFAGLPTALWLPQVQTSDGSFGVRSNQFGFNINWASGMTVVVEASTSLVNPTWSSISTNIPASGSAYFSDPEWSKYPTRFYRLGSAFWPPGGGVSCPIMPIGTLSQPPVGPP